MKYYLDTWNRDRGFRIVISDGDYKTYHWGDETEHEGKVYGTLGGWNHQGKKHQGWTKAEMFTDPEYDASFDPTTLKSYTKEEVIKQAIMFVFEKFALL